MNDCMGQAPRRGTKGAGGLGRASGVAEGRRGGIGDILVNGSNKTLKGSDQIISKVAGSQSFRRTSEARVRVGTKLGSYCSKREGPNLEHTACSKPAVTKLE